MLKGGTTKAILKTCQGVGGWFVCLYRVCGWFVCVRVPVLISGWDKPRCVRLPGKFQVLAKNQKWLYGSNLSLYGGQSNQIKETKQGGKSYT